MSGASALLSSLASGSSVGMVVWAASGRVLEANPAFYSLVGHEPGEGALDYWAVTPPSQKQRELNQLLMRAGEPFDKEFRGRDGVLRSVRIIGQRVSSADGADVFGAVVLPAAREERGSAAERERALRLQGELLLSLAQSQAIASGDFAESARQIAEAAGRGLGVSRASVWLYDEAKTKIVCRDLFASQTGEHSAGVELFARDFPSYFAALAEDRTISADDAHTHPATREFSAVYLAPLGIESMLEAPIRHKGELVGVLCHEHCGERRAWTQDEMHYAASMADFVGRALEAAERRRAEQALHELNEQLEQRVEQRTAELREANALVLRLQREVTETQMAGGFAHEMRNALSAARLVLSKALGSLDDGSEPHADPAALLNDLFLLVRDHLEPGQIDQARGLFASLFAHHETVTEVLASVDAAVERALQITTQIMDYSRLGQARRGVDEVDLPRLLLSVLDESRPMLEARQIEIDLDLDGKCRALGSESHFHSMAKNIVLNACDALGELGVGRPRRLSLGCREREGSVVIAVADTGIGMSDEVKARLFEPFFTTKPRTGTGLGMGVVKKLVELYGGSIGVESKPGVGTTVQIVVPASA